LKNDSDKRCIAARPHTYILINVLLRKGTRQDTTKVGNNTAT